MPGEPRSDEDRSVTAGHAGRHDIASSADVEALVRLFYSRALVDPMIGFLFTDVAKLDLEAHLPVIASFWDTILLGAQSYSGGAFAPHAQLNAQVRLKRPHFEQWLVLWRAAVDELFEGPTAEQAKAHALRVASAFLGRLDTFPSASDPTTSTPADPSSGLQIKHHGQD